MLRTSLTALISLLLACSPTSPAPTEAKPEVKPEAKPVTPAPEAASVTQAARPVRPPALAKGERRKLADQGDTTQRKAFWAAIQEGRKQTAGKDYAAAVAQFDAALAQLPDHPRALAGRGYARLLAGELDAAEADLRKALTHPGTAKVEAAIEFNLGLVAEKRGEADEAKRRGLDVSGVEIPGLFGELGVLPDHVPFVTPVVPGVVRFRDKLWSVAARPRTDSIDEAMRWLHHTEAKR